MMSSQTNEQAFESLIEKALEENLATYGFPKDATESDIVARLFKMYQELTSR